MKNKLFFIFGGISVGVLLLFFVGYGYYVSSLRGITFVEFIQSAFQSEENFPSDEKIDLEKTNEETIGEGQAREQLFEVLEMLRKDYVEKDIDVAKLYYGAMQGMVAALEDPYSVFLVPEVSEQFQEELSGRFEGIGAEIGIRNERLTIIAPLPDSPAESAGLLAGDTILAIDDVDAAPMTLEGAVRMIRGPKGEPVKLNIVHPGKEVSVDIEIIRDTIKILSVEYSMIEGNIAYVELKYFNHDTLDRFDAAVSDIAKKKPKGVILDLRNNPGGLLHTAIEVVSYWTGNDRMVVIEETRDAEKIAHKPLNRNDLLNGIPTVVLINAGSASGSEIVAGALQDYEVATLVGEKSFGKGSVQDLREFSDRSSLKLTIARWLTPAGRQIDKEGIVPDIEVVRTIEDVEADKDPQFDKAIEILR